MAISETEIQQNIQPGMPITEEKVMRLPKDGRRWELVDGRLTEAPTDWEHDIFGVNLIGLLLLHTHGLGFMSSGQAGFRMSEGNVRAPDVSYTRKERIPGGKPPRVFGVAAPNLCVESISPSERPADMARKVRDYFEGGAEQVWYIFPEEQRVAVFTAPTETRALNAEDTLTADGILPGFSCRIADLFIWE